MQRPAAWLWKRPKLGPSDWEAMTGQKDDYYLPPFSLKAAVGGDLVIMVTMAWKPKMDTVPVLGIWSSKVGEPYEYLEIEIMMCGSEHVMGGFVEGTGATKSFVAFSLSWTLGMAMEREREREMGSEWEVNGKLKAKGIGFYVGRHKRVQAHIYYRQC